MSHEFEIVQDVVIKATPEQIWKAVTDDTPAWMFPTAQWPAVRTVDEYPTHLVTRMEGPDGWYNQLEHVLTPGPDGTRLHYVHSGVMTDDWEQQYDGAANHTVFYLHTLGEYLAHFDGRPVAFSDVRGPDASEASDAFEKFVAYLGLEGASAGDVRALELPGLGRVEATVDFRNANFLGLRTRDALVRVFGRNAFGDRVGLTVHDFSVDAATPDERDARGEANTEAWTEWLAGVYA
ncbi:SRPBCC domain-containing protein [Sinomonas sp. ASV322]|uniref:SRPBCC domain-containing protein n=1 Tax=Sinomonas sp. ASV322 TaxID=3041920 RepID=UPI0027DCE152|nr:SRPBCC domain-containing protein [Sinomonas sp. ASV322]MDQ4503031.1 SRPBCC domain-containing protein [Sinomonas sp. ASV322]